MSNYEAELWGQTKAAMARLAKDLCRAGIIHEECGCPLADPESVKPVENPEPATDPESATGVTLQPVDSTGKAT